MEDRDLLSQTAAIVSSWAKANQVSRDDLVAAIREVHQTLRGLTTGEQPSAKIEPQRPAVPIKKSVTPDYLICLEDGRKLKMLRRHLRTTYNMSPAEYRAKWGLPSNYPMVAPNYSANRSDLAKRIGLGQKPKPVEDAVAKPAAKRGRRKRAST